MAVAHAPGPELASDSAAFATGRSIRLLAVDDHPAVRRGLRELLEDQPDFELVDVVSSAEQAMSVAERDRLDVAVVDYQLGGRNGLWLSRKLKRLPRPPRVIVYSAYCDGPLAAAAVVAEADGIVSKGVLGSELCDAIRSVAGGRSLLPVMPWRLGEVMRARLGADEQAIFGMLLARISCREIAQTLGISSADLESHLWQMLRTLEALNPEPTISDRGGNRPVIDAR
jgi:two-component system, NarL family, response regulator DevR